MSVLQLTGLEALQSRLAGALSYGEQRVLELNLAIACAPSLLLLDEPMAGISHENSQVMKQLLLGLKQRYTIVLVEHDMDIVFDLADTITVMVEGSPIASGSVEDIKQNVAVKQAYLGEETFVVTSPADVRA